MADRFSRASISRETASAEARRATDALFARIAADRRRTRRGALRRRDIIVDIVVALSTYAGIAVAVVLGAIYGLRAAAGLLIG